MSNIFTNMTTEELEVKFKSGTYKIPHSGYERCTLVKTKVQKVEGEWTDVTFDREIMNQMNEDKDLDGVDYVEIKNNGTYSVMFQAKGADKFRITKNEESLVESDTGTAIVLNFEAEDKIALQSYGAGELDNSHTHLSVVRIF